MALFKNISDKCYFSVALFLVAACFSQLISSSYGTTVENKDLLLTIAEKDVLDKFQEQAMPLLTEKFMTSELWLVRWLRAQNFNLPGAMSVLRAHLKWRQQQRIANILNEDWSDMEKRLPTFHTHDAAGREVIGIELGKWNIRGVVFQGQRYRFLRYMRYLMEKATRHILEEQRVGLNATQWTLVIDAEGYNVVRHLCLFCTPLWLQFINNLETHYGGWANQILVINSPPSLTLVLETFRPFLGRNTRKSLKVYGRGRSGSPLLRLRPNK